MAREIVGRSFGSTTVAVKTEDGSWKVTVDMVEKRLLEGASEWEEKTISTECTDDSFEKAYGVALNSTMEKFNDMLEETGQDGMFLPVEEE